MATKKAAPKKKAKALPKRKKFGEKFYSKKACSTTKAGAKKTAESHRAKGKGKTARVVKDPVTKKWCTFTRG